MAKDTRKMQPSAKGKFEALKYVKELERRAGKREEPPRKDEPSGKEKEEDKKILELIKEAENELLALKEKVDTKNLEAMLKDASEALRAGDPTGAHDIVKKLREEIDKVVESHIEKRFFDAEMLIIELEVVGIDVSSSKAIVQDGKKVLKEKKLKEALTLAEKAATEVEKLQRQQVMEVMTYATSIIESLKAFHVDVAKFEKSAEDAKKELEKKRFEKAMEIVIGLESEVSAFRVQKFDELVEQTKDIILTKEKEGKDVTEAQAMLKRAHNSIDVKDFEAASEYLIEARYAADKDAGLEFKAKAGLRTSQERYDELKKDGIVSAACVEHLTLATKAIEKKEFEEALMEAKKAEAAIVTALREHDRIAKRIEAVKVSKGIAAGFGCNLLETDSLLGQASEALGKGEFELALDFTTQADEELARSVNIKAKAEREELMEAAKSVHDGKVEPQLVEALELIAESKVERGFQLIGKVRSRLAGAVEKINTLKQGIATVQEKIEALAVEGVDIAEAMDIIEKVQTAMGEGDFAKARSEFYHAERLVGQWTADRVYDTLCGIERDVGAFERFGLPPPAVDDMLDESWSHFVRGDKDKAVEMSNQLKQSVGNYKKGFISAMDEIQLAQHRIHHASVMGIGIDGAVSTLDKAFDQLAGVDFTGGAETAKKAMTEVVSAEEKSVRDLLTSTEASIVDMESNFPVPLARDRLSRAKALLELGAYFNTYTELRQAADYISNLNGKLESLDTQFEETASLLHMGDAIDVDIAAFQNLLDEAKANKTSGHLEMAISLLDQVREDAQEIYLIRINEKKEQVNALISELEAKKVDVEDARKGLRDSEGHLKTKDFINAFVALSDGHKGLLELKDRYEQATKAFKDLTARVERATGYKLDTKRYKDKLGRIQSSLASGQLTEALDSAGEIDSDLNEGLSKLVDKRLKEELEDWIDRARAFNIKVKDAERFLDLAKGERDSENYEAAMENIGRGIEICRSGIKAQIDTQLEEIGEAIGDARSEGIAPGPVSKLLDKTTRSIEEERYEDASKLMKELQEGLAEQRSNHEKAKSAMEECQKKIKGFQQDGANLKVALETLEAAKQSMSSGEYDLAMDMISQSGDTAENIHKSYIEAKSSIEEALVHIENLTDLDIDTLSLTEESTKVYDHIDQGEYSTAIEMAFDLKERAEKIRIEHYETRINDLKAKMEAEAAKKEDITALSSHISNLEAALMSREFENLTKTVDDGYTILADIGKRYIDESKKVATAEKELAKFEKKGTILHEARKCLEEAKTLLEERNYSGLSSVLEKAKQAASAADEAKTDAKVAIDKASGSVELPFEELDNKRLVELFGQAKSKFSDGFYEESIRLAENTVEEAKMLQTEFVSKKFAEWETLKDDAEAEGVNTAPAQEQVKQVPDLIKDGSFVPAYDFCKDAIDTTNRLRSEHAKAKELLEQLETMTAEAKAMTIATDAAEEMAHDVKEAFELPDYIAAADLAQHAIEDLASERDSFFTALTGSLEDGIVDAKGMQVPVNKPAELLKQAQELLDNKRYLDAYRTFIDAKKALEEVSKGYEETSSKLAEFQTAVTEARDHGVAVEKIEAVLAKSRDYLSEARFEEVEKALGIMKDSLSKSWKAVASTRMEEVQLAIKDLEKIGAPTSDILELFNGASSALELGEFQEVLTICGTAMDMVGAKRQEYDRARLAVEEARKSMDLLEGIPAELDKVKTQLEEAEAMLKEGKLDEAETLAKSVKEGMDDVMGPFLKERLDKVQGEVDDALQSGARSADLDFTNKAIDALSEKDYRTAWDMITKGEKALKDVLRDYRSARSALESATNQVYEAEQELDLTSALECIDQANASLETGDYQGTEELSKRATDELTKATRHYLDSQLSTTELLIRRLEMGGKVKLLDASKIEAQAKDAFANDDLAASKSLIRKAAREAKRARANYEIAKDVISALEEVFSAQSINLNILKKGREKAKAAFERDYEKILEKEDEVPPAGPLAAQLILQYQVKFEETIMIEIDITKAKNLLVEAKAALEGNDYNGAVQLAKECYETVRQSERAATMRTLLTMQEHLDDIKERCVDCSIQEQLLERARVAANEGDTSTAFRYMNECNESLGGLKDEHKETAEVLHHAETALILAGHMGVEAPAAVEMLASANTMMADNDFESAKDLSRQGLDEVYRAKHEKVSARHGEILAYLENIEKDGVPIHRAKHLLKKSKDLLETQEYIRALHLAEKAEAEARLMAKMHAEVKDVMSATSEKIEYAKSLGIDLAAIEQLQTKVATVLATGKHEKVKELSAEIESELLRSIVEQCNKSINDAQEKVKEAESLGLKVDDLRDEFKKAGHALEEEDFDTVISTTKDLMSRVDALMTKEVTARLELLKKHLEDATASGITVPKGEAHLKTAEEAAGAGDNKKALEALLELGEGIKSERLKKVKELLSNTDKMIKAGEKEKVDVFSAKGFLDEAEDALSREEVDEAFDFAVQAYNNVKEIHLKYINGILNMSKQVLEMAVETGGDTKRVETFLEKTQELMDKDNFDRALFYAKQCAREADRLQFKLIQSMISKLEGDLTADEKKDLTKPKELLEEAKSALLTKKYDLARETVLKCRDELTKAQAATPEEPKDEPKPATVEPALAELEGQAADIMEGALEVIRDLKGEEVEVGDIEEVYAEAKKALLAQDFVAAVDAAEKAKAMAEERKARIFGPTTKEETPKPVEKPPEPEQKPASVPEEKPAKPAAPELTQEQAALAKTVEDLIEEGVGLGLDVAPYKMEAKNATQDILEGRQAKGEVALKDILERLKKTMASFKEVDTLVSDVDKFLTIATNYSFDVHTPQALFQQGLSQRRTDMASATESFKKAKDEVLTLLEGVYPYITFDMAKEKPMTQGNWNDTFFYVSNTGNILARELTIEVEGAEIEGKVVIQKIDIGETREIPVKMRTQQPGQQTIKMKVTFLRDFDSRMYLAEFPQVIVAVPGGAGVKSLGGSRAKQPTATEVSDLPASRCSLCQGDIKENQFRVTCTCGKDYHETCASKIADCVLCNRPLKNVRG